MEDWKDLEIGNIPSDFFVNDNYEIEGMTEGKWKKEKIHQSNKICIVSNLTRCWEYRYRLKSLGPIKIAKKDNQTIDDAMVILSKSIQHSRYYNETERIHINKTMRDLIKILNRVETID